RPQGLLQLGLAAHVGAGVRRSIEHRHESGANERCLSRLGRTKNDDDLRPLCERLAEGRNLVFASREPFGVARLVAFEKLEWILLAVRRRRRRRDEQLRVQLVEEVVELGVDGEIVGLPVLEKSSKSTRDS